LTKEEKDIYNAKYKILKKEIDETLEEAKTFHAHGLAKLIF
jgi:hypothetical protein